MHRLRAIWRTAALSACSVLMVAGCPNTNLLELVNENLGLNLTEEDVVDALRSLLEDGLAVDQEVLAEIGADAITDETTDALDSDHELFVEVPPSAIEISAAAMIEQETTADGLAPIAVGGLAGVFIHNRPGDPGSGVMRGRWFGGDDQVLGLIRGDFQATPTGARLPRGLAGGGVFHAKIVDPDGRFRAYMQGRYGHARSGRAMFFGRWFGRNHELLGVVRGYWQDADDRDGGRFAGRWAAYDPCGEDDTLEDGEHNDGDFEDGDHDDGEHNDGDFEDGFGGLDASDVDLAEVDFDDVEFIDAVDALDVDDSPEVEFAGDREPCWEASRPHGILRGWHAPDGSDRPGDQFGDGWLRARVRNADGVWIGMLIGRWDIREPETGNATGGGDAASGPPQELEPDSVEGTGPIGGDDGVTLNVRQRARVHGVFHARFVNRAGEFRGLVRGVFGESPHGVGIFRGRYFNGDHEQIGVIRGRWNEDRERPGGPTFGVWFGVDLDHGDDAAEEE